VVVSSSPFCSASILEYASVRYVFWCWWCFNGSGGVSTPVVVLVLFGSRVVLRCNACSVSWFLFQACDMLFDGLEWFCSWFPATELVLFLVHEYWW
jgi:hypothetical protein